MAVTITFVYIPGFQYLQNLLIEIVNKNAYFSQKFAVLRDTKNANFLAPYP